MSDYIPIDCALYARYELAVLHRQRLRVAWRNQDGTAHLEVLLPTDLNTRNHAEFMLARTTTGGVLELRLDQIIRTQPFGNSSR